MKSLLIIIMVFQVTTAFTGCESATTPTTRITWRIAATLPLVDSKQPGVAGASSGIHKEVMLVAGGANFPDSMPWLGGRKKYHDDVYAFTRTADGQLKPWEVLLKLDQPLAYAASVTTEQGIICAGGENDKGILKDVFIMKWDEPKKDINISTLPSLPFALTNASITADGDKVYLAGGEMVDSVSNQFLCLDLNNTNAGWKMLAPLPHPVSHAVLALISDNSGAAIYLAGGRKKNQQSISTLYKEVFAYDISENKWHRKTALPYALSAAAGITIENSMLIFGGDRGESFHRTESLIAEINKAKSPEEKERLNAEKTKLQTAHPGFAKEVLQYHTSTGQWKIIDTIPFDVPVTTTVFRWKDDFIIPSGEIRAGVRTPFILAGKLTNK